jgi:hypothetical protein
MKVTYLAGVSRTAISGTPNATGNPVDPKSRDILRRTAAIFMGDLSARELYAAEHSAKIKETMDAISPHHPGLIGGALRNKALGILWAKQDHSVLHPHLAGQIILMTLMAMTMSHFPVAKFGQLFSTNLPGKLLNYQKLNLLSQMWHQ